MNNIVVPNFTKEDYIRSTAPFEWLYRFKDDKFMLAQARELIKSQAGSVGVKGFLGLWKAYLQSIADKRNISLDNVTDFEGQELELLTGEWIADESGVYTSDKYGFEIVACNHPIMPVQRLINIDTESEKLKIAYKKKGKNWRTIIADKKTLASASSIIGLAEYGIAVNSENAKYLVRYLTDIESLNQDTIGEINSVGRLGWIENYGFSPYVDNLMFDGDISFKHYFESVQNKGKYDEWLKLVKDIRTGGTIGRIMLAASFGSVLISPCNALPFFVHLWGGSEAGKTVALMLAASVWANPAIGSYIHTFNSTQVGQELSASFVNSMPLIIDELQIISDRKDFDKMIYTLSEGIGRSRGAKTGGLQKINTWQNCILTSGEMPITNNNSMSGAVNRIVEIDCKDQKIFADPLHVLDIIKTNYGFAGKEFVSKLQEPGNIDYAVQTQKSFYKQLIKSESAEKQVMAASVVLAADKLINEWIFMDGQTLNTDDILPFLATKKQVSANERAFEYIVDFLAINRGKFQKNSFGDYDGDIWGELVNNQQYSNDSGNFAYIIKSQFDKLMKNEGYNPIAFLSWAKQKGILRYKQGRNTVMKRIAGNLCNCICIKLDSDLPDSEYPSESELDTFDEDLIQM